MAQKKKKNLFKVVTIVDGLLWAATALPMVATHGSEWTAN
jgi:hypothetical protein